MNSTPQKHNQNEKSFSPIKELRWLFFDLNSYFASCEQQDRPELRGKPVAVLPMLTDGTCAIAASYEAKAYGIKTGTKIYDAIRMCPGLKCILARHDVYVDYHERIMNEVERHIPITKKWSIDEASCELLGAERQPENALKIAENIKAGLYKNVGSQLTCSIGIGPNSLLAKIAAEMKKPDGLTILDPENLPKHLFKRKLMDLPGINVAMDKRLRAARINTVEDLWNISPRHARKIWRSVEGERFWYQLHGYEIPGRETKKSMIGHSRVLDRKIRTPDKAFDITLQLTVKAASRLRRYNLFARKMGLKLYTVDKIRWADEYIFSPTQDNFTFTKALEDMWHAMLIGLNTPDILRVSVAFYDLYEHADITPDLFETTAQNEKPQKLTESMDSINKRYGANTINIGSTQKTLAGFVGTKIAFSRIPQNEEFSE